MTKIAIISQPEQGILIDVGGCASLNEAKQHLSSTLQGQGQAWNGLDIDLNLGTLSLDNQQLVEVFATLQEAGVKPRKIYAESEATQAALQAHCVANTNDAAVESCTMVSDFTPDTEEQQPERPSVEMISVECELTPTETPAPAQDAAPAVPHVLYMRTNLRSGQSISHKGHLIIIGDVNPGAEVVADGDITIWGALRGVAHAGVNGNDKAEIRALRFEPIQLRIAHSIARAPDRPRTGTKSAGAETARIVNGSIRISSSEPI